MAKKPPPPSVDDEIRGLYHGPLDGFTAARKALAKRLRQAGDPRHGEVGELAKPSLSAWAVDRLFAEEPRGMAALVGAGERARAAQRRAGKGADPAALRALVATIQGETEQLTARGAEILAEGGGRAPGEAIVERLHTNLQALALDPATAEVAARGWLDRDLEPPGFEHLAALQVAAAGARGPARPPATRPAAPGKQKPAAGKARGKTGGKADREPAGATVHSLDEARNAAAERKRREAQERLERARAELSSTEEEAAEARRAAERAGEEAERAERAAAEAERRAEAARAGARAARKKADEAGERAAAAEARATRALAAVERAERS